ncbi:MAG: J domain-containing protein [Sediminibacterium sp.]
MPNSTQGIDYLVDYYAVLGIERDSTLEQVKQAYRTKQKQYHPDLFQGLAPELLGQAEKKVALISEAHKALSDPTTRAEYDALLETWDKPISRNGEVIIDLNASGFSLSNLVENLSVDAETREQEAEKLALQFSNSNPATYSFFCQQADTDSGIPEALKAAYLEQLDARDLYLSLRETFLWESLGLKNHTLSARLDYADQVEEDLKDTADRAIESVEEQVLLLTVGERTLLPAPEGMESKADSSTMLAHYKALIDEHIERQAELLRPIAAEREQVLNARFIAGSGFAYHSLHPQPITYTQKLVIEAKLKDRSIWFSFEFMDNNTRVVSHEVEGLERLSDPAVAEEWILKGYNLVSFVVQEGVDVKSQLTKVSELHLDHLEGK